MVLTPTPAVTPAWSTETAVAVRVVQKSPTVPLLEPSRTAQNTMLLVGSRRPVSTMLPASSPSTICVSSDTPAPQSAATMHRMLSPLSCQKDQVPELVVRSHRSGAPWFVISILNTESASRLTVCVAPAVLNVNCGMGSPLLVAVTMLEVMRSRDFAPIVHRVTTVTRL